jgi:hypothetical protein
METLTVENELTKINIIHKTKLNELTMNERVTLMYRLQQLLLANKK